MSDKGPLEIIDRFAKAVEAHPEALPLSIAEREAIKRVTVFFRRLDETVWLFGWFFGWGKWVVAVLIFVVTQWDRVERTLKVWIGG